MPRPVVTPTTEDAYASLGPLTRHDETYDWPLLRYLDAMLRQLDEIEQLARDSDEYDGWGKLLDLQATPDKALPWLAQLVGVVPLQGLDAESQRIRIGEAAGWHRGTPSAIRGAMKQFLTGSRTTQIFERYQGNPYRLRVRTFAAETPNPAKVEEAVRALKPAGIVLTYDVSEGQAYGDIALDAEVTDYASLAAKYPTYEDLRYGIPPEV